VKERGRKVGGEKEKNGGDERGRGQRKGEGGKRGKERGEGRGMEKFCAVVIFPYGETVTPPLGTSRRISAQRRLRPHWITLGAHKNLQGRHLSDIGGICTSFSEAK